MDDKSITLVGLEAMELVPGTPLQLQVIGEVGHKNYAVTYIGAVKGRSVLVTLPQADGKGMWMPPGKSHVLRGFNGKYVYAFTTQVLKARAEPFPYVHFAYPTEVQAKIIRKVLRIELNLPATVTCAGETLSVSIVNLSAQGAMIKSPQSLGTSGAQVDVRFSLAIDDMQSELSLKASIRNTPEMEAGSGFLSGVEFEHVPRSDRLLLDYYLHAVTSA